MIPLMRIYPAGREKLSNHCGSADAHFRVFAVYFETPMIGNFFAGRNSFCGISRDMVLTKAKRLDMNRESYGFTYSNFGYAVLGCAEAVYDQDYTVLLNDYVQNAWAWLRRKSLNVTGIWAITGTGRKTTLLVRRSSNVEYRRYAPICADATECGSAFAQSHESLKVINASSRGQLSDGNPYGRDRLGLDHRQENGIVWHNGGTGITIAIWDSARNRNSRCHPIESIAE